jgi:hypothetical protein
MTSNALAAFTEGLMAGGLDLIVEVSRSDIVIMMSRGRARVTYRKSPDTSQLVVKSELASNDKDTKIRLGRFRTRAWRLANDAALKFGWFEMS